MYNKAFITGLVTIMMKYEYVSVYVGKFFGAKCEDHRIIIDEYAAKGYRYIGFIPTGMDGYGKSKAIDLIFETER
jgi:hypothetical protein